MPCPSENQDKDNSGPFDDQWGACIRRGLLESVQDQQPGKVVWERILQRIEEHDWPSVSDPALCGRPSPLAHLVQAVVASTLLLTFVFGAHQGPLMPRRDPPAPGATPVVRRVAAHAEFQEDMLRGVVLMRMEKERLSRRGGYVRGTHSLP